MTHWRAVARVLRSPQQIARTVFHDLFTTVLPADCRACGGPLLKAGVIPVCDSCFDSLAPQAGQHCQRCGEALGSSLDLEDLRFSGMLPEGLLCTPCRAVPPDFTRAVAHTVYRDEARTLIHLLKYEGVRGIAQRLAPVLANTISTLRPQAATELTVIAVPLFASRQRQRGYNQSVLLADAAIRQLKRSAPNWQLTPAHHLLTRVRHTEEQYSLTPVGRRRNLRGAFRIADKTAVTGREILLIDDIFTTGATARECSRVLIRAGAAKVWVATVARAQAARAEQHSGDYTADTAAWDTSIRPTTTFVSTAELQPSIAPPHERRM